MKILSLRLKNLNALHGEWKIDFTEKPFLEQGLFVISGVEGAGKTTLLDAICMALYHKQFPATSRKANQETLMSEGASDCLAEVEFRVDDIHYRAFWSQRRSRFKVDGKIQEPQVELFDRTHGVLLEHKLKSKLQHMQQITGMGFELFIKTTLLDRTGFACFLNTPSQDKPKVLEQLTGTEVYQIVSQRMFQCFQETKQALACESKSLDNMRVLSQDSLYQLKQKQKYLTDQVKKCHDELVKREHQLTWWQDFQKTLTDYDTAYHAYEDACHHEKNLDQELQELHLESKAISLHPIYTHYGQSKQRLESETCHHTNLQDAIQKIEGHQQSLNLLWQHDQNLVHQLTEKIASTTPSPSDLPTDPTLIQNTLYQERKNEILMINRLAQLRKKPSVEGYPAQEYELLKKKESIQYCESFQTAIQESQAQCDADQAAVNQAQLACDKDQKQFLFMQKHFSAMERHQYQLSEKIEQVKQRLEYPDAKAYNQQKERFAELYASGWTRTQLVAMAKDSQQAAMAAAELNEKLADLRKQKPKLHTQYHKMVKQHQKQKDKLKTLLKTQYRTIQTTKVSEEIQAFDKASNLLFVALEKVVVSKSALETEQQWLLHQKEKVHERQKQHKATWRQLKTKAGLSSKMKFNEPHIWLNDLENQQVLQEKILKNLTSYERTCQVISGLESEYYTNQKDVQSNAQAMMALEQQVRVNRASLESATKQLNESKQSQKNLLFSAAQSLNGLEGLNPTLCNLDEVVENLQNQYRKLKSEQQKASTHELSLCDAELELAETQQNISLLQEKLLVLKNQTSDASAWSNQPQSAEDNLNDHEALQQAKIQLSDREQTYASLQESLQDYKQQIQVSQQNIMIFEAQHQQALHQWQHTLAQSAFHSEAQYLACEPKISAVIAQKKERDQAQWQRQQRYEALQNAKKKWEKMKASPLYEALKTHSLAQMMQKKQQTEKQIETIEQEQNWVDEQLKQDSDLRRISQEKIQRVQELEKEFEDLDYLTYLMGSQKGEKLRRFAQGLTLDALIHSANQSLVLFDNRYQIERLDSSSKNLVLDLQLIDQWQMNEPQPIEQCSMEAQFLVSLTLALGLTELLSDKNPTQSLFLQSDFEGFEPASIEVVIDALSQLHHKSKLIGLICNEEAMQDRVSTQIRVIKQSGLGVSRLESHFRM